MAERVAGIWRVLAQGGWVMVPLAVVCAAAWTLAFERWRALRELTRRAAPTTTGAAPIRAPAECAALAFEAGRGLDLLAALIAAAPLLGLLGTVDGMIESFAVLAQSGRGDPRALSAGIARALLTTQAGLVIALPGLVAHARLRRRADRLARLLAGGRGHL